MNFGIFFVLCVGVGLVGMCVWTKAKAGDIGELLKRLSDALIIVFGAFWYGLVILVVLWFSYLGVKYVFHLFFS